MFFIILFSNLGGPYKDLLKFPAGNSGSNSPPSLDYFIPIIFFFLNHMNLKIKIECKIKNKKTGKGEGCAETGDCSHIYALLPRLYNRSI